MPLWKIEQTVAIIKPEFELKLHKEVIFWEFNLPVDNNTLNGHSETSVQSQETIALVDARQAVT